MIFDSNSLHEESCAFCRWGVCRQVVHEVAGDGLVVIHEADSVLVAKLLQRLEYGIEEEVVN